LTLINSFASDAFTERVREFFSGKEKVSGIPRLQSLAGRPTLQTLFPKDGVSTKTERNQAFLKAPLTSS
jgi:hypothetical protein